MTIPEYPITREEFYIASIIGESVETLLGVNNIWSPDAYPASWSEVTA